MRQAEQRRWRATTATALIATIFCASCSKQSREARLELADEQAAPVDPPSASPSDVEPLAEAEPLADAEKMADAEPPALVLITISPEARVKADAAPDSPRDLRQGRWVDFTLEIENAAGITAPLDVRSDQELRNAEDPDRQRWMRLELLPDGQLTGLRHETRRIRIWSRDAGTRTAVLNFDAGQGTQDLGFRSDVLLTFRIEAE